MSSSGARSVSLQLPVPDRVDGELAVFGQVLVGAGGVDAPGVSSSDPAVLRAYAAAVLAAVDMIERGAS